MSDHEKQIARLGHVCAMLASPNECERAAAALLATRKLIELGLDWREFTRRALAPVSQPGRGKVEQGVERPDWVHDCKARSDLIEWLMFCAPLTDWERRFVSSLTDWPSLTDKQAACMERIVQKYTGPASGGGR